MFLKIFLLISFSFFISLNAENTRSLKMMKIEQRVALVIGNNKYDSKKLPNLRNPINDAKAMKSKLENLGFKVYYGENLTVRDMDKKLRLFSSKLKNGGVGLFFFAGHGIESQGENYLVGKDSNLEEKDEISYESLELSKVLSKMKNSGNRLNIVLLDACRNDPFSRSAGGGLAKTTARGTFIAYATSPGDVADDGNGKNGVFTTEILKQLDNPGMPIERVFKNVKVGVLEKTNYKQRPWTSNDIVGDFYFKLPKIETEEKKSSIVGVWLITRKDGYQSNFHFFTNKKAGEHSKDFNYRYEIKNNIINIYWKDNKKPYLVGNISINKIKSSINTGFWSDWSAVKIDDNPNVNHDLYQVCGNRVDRVKRKTEWYCSNVGQNERCTTTIPWFNSTSTSFNECKKQCKEYPEYRKNLKKPFPYDICIY